MLLFLQKYQLQWRKKKLLKEGNNQSTKGVWLRCMSHHFKFYGLSSWLSLKSSKGVRSTPLNEKTENRTNQLVFNSTRLLQQCEETECNWNTILVNLHLQQHRLKKLHYPGLPLNETHQGKFTYSVGCKPAKFSLWLRYVTTTCRRDHLCFTDVSSHIDRCLSKNHPFRW